MFIFIDWLSFRVCACVTSKREHTSSIAEAGVIYLRLKENVRMTNAFPLALSYELFVPTHLTFGKQLHRNCTPESNAPVVPSAALYEI